MTIAERLARPDLLGLAAYQSASWHPGHIRLHANENPWRAVGDDSQDGLARYPEPVPTAVQDRLADLYGVQPEQLLATRGADEGIDLLTRGFLQAGVDAAIICPPTFGMYAVATQIQGGRVVEVPLTAAPDFALDVPSVCRTLLETGAKLLFLCTPGNPTARDLATHDVEAVLSAAAGRALVIVDEAYVEFSGRRSWTERLHEFPHLVVLRTLSKAYSLAGARVGSVIADPSIIAFLGKLIPPYSMSSGSIEATLRALSPSALPIAQTRIARLVQARDALAQRLAKLPEILAVGPSQANFLYVTAREPQELLARAQAAGFLLRDFSGGRYTPRGIRISIGEPAINERLVEALRTS